MHNIKLVYFTIYDLRSDRLTSGFHQDARKDLYSILKNFRKLRYVLTIREAYHASIGLVLQANAPWICW